MIGDQSLQADDPLMEAGFNSLSALDYRKRLTTALSLTLPATFMFD
jgi:hypothetical protein